MIVLRFLLLEDNPLDAEVIQATLSDSGIVCELLRVETRSSFVAALETHEFDLILADYALPGFDGISALEIACNLCPDVPFIFVTASLGEELAIKTLKSGATDYVLKQRLERLVPCVKRALREAQERRDRKRAEAALQESEERLSLAVEGAGMATWDVDLRTGNTQWSERHFRLLGYEPNPSGEATLEMWRSRVHPNDLEQVMQAMEQARQKRSLYCPEHRIIRADNGEICWLSVFGRFLYNETGEAVRFIGVFFDNTKRKQAEESLIASEAKLTGFVEANVIGILYGDIYGNINEANDELLRMVGYTREDLRAGQLRWLDITPPEYLPLDEQHIAEARARGACTPYEKEYIRKDGSRVPVLVGYNLIGEAREESVAFILDLSDRKQAEEALRQSEARLKQLVELNLLGVMFWDVDGRVLDANDAFLNMVGYSREDLQAGRVNWRAITPPEQLDRSEYSLNTMRQQQSSDPLEKEYICKDGKRVPILLGGVMFKHSQNRGVSFVVDISTRKQAELQLQQQASELKQFNLALEQTTSKLTERNQELDRFVYTVSHDLKAPLRAIANLSQWIEDDLEGQLTPENQRQMELLRQRVSRLEAMIDGLLAYSRIGRTEVTTERINVDELLFEILDSLAPPLTFTISVQPEMPILLAKRLLLSQVFSNLISNAIKHHDRSDGWIEIRATQKGEYYEFSVTDNGRGIAPENHERVFGLFQTLKGHDVKESTGIGLSIVKKIIETEGGQIFLESQLGEGATFRFTWLIQPLGFHE